jgi:hypothetical protein
VADWEKEHTMNVLLWVLQVLRALLYGASAQREYVPRYILPALER